MAGPAPREGEKVLENPSRGKRLADVSYLFLSQPLTKTSAQRGPGKPDPGEIPAVFVTSGRDFLTRSVVAVNIAVDLGLHGIRTTLVDADPAAPVAHFIAGGAAARSSGRTSLPLGKGRVLSIVDRAADADPQSRCLVVNATAGRWPDGMSVARTRNLLLVTSPSIQDCFQGFAIVKQVAAADPGLRLGIIVTGVADEKAGRSLYERIAAVISRHTSATTSFCGWLAPGDWTGPSVRARVPALLASAEPDLSNRLRRIAAMATSVFDLQNPVRPIRRFETLRSARRGPELTEDEIGDFFWIMHPRSVWQPGHGMPPRRFMPRIR